MNFLGDGAAEIVEGLADVCRIVVCFIVIGGAIDCELQEEDRAGTIAYVT